MRKLARWQLTIGDPLSRAESVGADVPSVGADVLFVGADVPDPEGSLPMSVWGSSRRF